MELYENENYQHGGKERAGAFAWCCSSPNGLTKLGLILSVIGVLILVALAITIPVIFILKHNQITTNSSSITVKIPKRMAIYYGWPSAVQNANGNVTAAIQIFGQFDLVVFGAGIESPSHGDHTNTQTIIQALNNLGKLTFGYVDLGVTTQNYSIARMQSSASNWSAMGAQGIMWDDAG